MTERSYLEITTQIGCCVSCLKYCPQEVYVKRYKGISPLTVEEFGRLIKTVPKTVTIVFAGISEPLQNKQCPDMILKAHTEGYPVQVYSTLTGLSPEDAMRICKIPFDSFTLHLPDPYDIAKIRSTEEYRQSLEIILRNVEHLSFMNMGYSFVSDGRERKVRGELSELKRGRVKCLRHDNPTYFTLPNGDVYFCCVAKGTETKLGNLFEEPFEELASRFSGKSYKLQTTPDSMCHNCSYAKRYFHYQFLKNFGKYAIELKRMIL